MIKLSDYESDMKMTRNAQRYRTAKEKGMKPVTIRLTTNQKLDLDEAVSFSNQSQQQFIEAAISLRSNFVMGHIVHLNLDTRIHNCLIQNGNIHNISQLLRHTRFELIHIEGISISNAETIRYRLREYSLYLKGESEEWFNHKKLLPSLGLYDEGRDSYDWESLSTGESLTEATL